MEVLQVIGRLGRQNFCHQVVTRRIQPFIINYGSGNVAVQRLIVRRQRILPAPTEAQAGPQNSGNENLLRPGVQHAHGSRQRNINTIVAQVGR